MRRAEIVMPNGMEWWMSPEEMRRLFSLARLGLQAAKDRGMTSTTDQTLEAVLHSDRVRF